MLCDAGLTLGPQRVAPARYKGWQSNKALLWEKAISSLWILPYVSIFPQSWQPCQEFLVLRRPRRMLLLVNGNKWAGFTVFLMFHVCTMPTATRGEGKFMGVHSISNDTTAEQQRAKLTCCLTFPCKDSLLPRLSEGHCFLGGGVGLLSIWLFFFVA